VTGCSSGLGKALAIHIAKSGHRLVATARKPSALAFLEDSERILKLQLDVTSPTDVANAFRTAADKFGRVDVVVNNAGYGLYGDTEATSDELARKQMDTNFWGPATVTREAIRVFREVNPKGEGGTVVQISSMGGYVGYPGGAFYHASKFALEGFTESVAKEVHPDWNIKFLLVEPGGIHTEFTGTSMVFSENHPAYKDPSCPTRQLEAYMHNPEKTVNWADPSVVAHTVFDVVVDQGVRPLPLRLPIGSDAWGMIQSKNWNLGKQLMEWKAVSESCSSEEQLKSIEFLDKK